MDMNKLALVPLWMIPFIFSLSFHEYAHAWMANRLGDGTARFMGRLSMNPKVHVDPIGTIAFPLIGFMTGFPLIGWAKPVMINERNFKKPYKDAMYVAASGPLANLILALCFTLIARLINQGNSMTMRDIGFDQPLLMMAVFGIQLNVFLAFFNLIPLPPLDGGRVLRGLIPSIEPQLAMIEQYGFIIILVLLYTGMFRVILEPASRVINVLMSLI
jgi:Zn-dependent protease